MKLLPQGKPYWIWDIMWDLPVFRVLYLGLWCVGIDRSKAYYKRWPHISITWNDDAHN